MNTYSIDKISRRLKAISDPTRIKILLLLSRKECCVCELTEAIGFSQPTISRHLSLLEREGFISGKRDKNWIIYRISPMETCCRQLLDVVLSRAQKDTEAKKILDRLPDLDRHRIYQDKRRETQETK